MADENEQLKEFLQKFVEFSFTNKHFPVQLQNYESRLAVTGNVELVMQFDRVITFPDLFDRVNAFEQLINTVKA